MEELLRLRMNLITFAETVELPEDALAQSERVDEIVLNHEEFPANGLSRLTAAVCKPLTNLCGNSLRITVKLDALTIFSLSEATTDVDYASLLRDLADQSTATLELVLDKRALCKRWGVAMPRPVHHLFLFASRCEEILRGTIQEPSQLEELLWPGGARGPCVVVLADRAICLDGPYLSVLGGSRFAEWVGSERTTITGQELAAIHDTCHEVVRWEKPWLSHLAPPAFRVSGDDDTSPLAQAILAHWANASILFLADRVREQGIRNVAIFATEKYRAQVTLITLNDLETPLARENVEALGDMAEWSYEARWGGDRIRMIQAVVAQALALLPQPTTTSTLLSQAPDFWRDLQWNWKSFIGKEIDRYTVEERELESEVSETVGSFDTEVADMIKALTSTMLGAVGALIGSMIAAAFKEPFNPVIFNTGLFAFFVYLTVFPGIFGLSHHWIRFLAIFNLFVRRRERYERAIGKDRFQHIVGDAIENAIIRFKWWFWCTAIAIAVVALLCVGAVFCVPSALGPTINARGKGTITVPFAQPSPRPPAPVKPEPTPSTPAPPTAQTAAPPTNKLLHPITP